MMQVLAFVFEVLKFAFRLAWGTQYVADNVLANESNNIEAWNWQVWGVRTLSSESSTIVPGLLIY
jgi:hypothetical protein